MPGIVLNALHDLFNIYHGPMRLHLLFRALNNSGMQLLNVFYWNLENFFRFVKKKISMILQTFICTGIFLCNLKVMRSIRGRIIGNFPEIIREV